MSNAQHDAARSLFDLERAESGTTLDEDMDRRIAGLAEWLQKNAPEINQQRHLDDGSRERAYWHYGYLVALRDLRDLLRGRRSSLN
jgi:hypothetical protein